MGQWHCYYHNIFKNHKCNIKYVTTLHFKIKEICLNELWTNLLFFYLHYIVVISAVAECFVCTLILNISM